MIVSVGQVQFWIQIKSKPLREESYPLFRASWNRCYEFLRVQRILLVLCSFSGFRRLDSAARKFQLRGINDKNVRSWATMAIEYEWNDTNS